MATHVATFKSSVGSRLAHKTDCKSSLASPGPTTLPANVEQAHTIVGDTSYELCVADGNLFLLVTVLQYDERPLDPSDLRGPLPAAVAAFTDSLLAQLR